MYDLAVERLNQKPQPIIIKPIYLLNFKVNKLVFLNIAK